MKSNILKFEVLKEEITAENVLEMSEVIAFAQTRFLIGYMGTRMQKIYAEVYADIKHKKDIRRVLSDGYELVQEGALYLCEHYGRRLNDVIGYNKKGKAITIRIRADFFIYRYLSLSLVSLLLYRLSPIPGQVVCELESFFGFVCPRIL